MILEHYLYICKSKYSESTLGSQILNIHITQEFYPKSPKAIIIWFILFEVFVSLFSVYSTNVTYLQIKALKESDQCDAVQVPVEQWRLSGLQHGS